LKGPIPTALPDRRLTQGHRSGKEEEREESGW
jgi:hypothetical protein